LHAYLCDVIFIIVYVCDIVYTYMCDVVYMYEHVVDLYVHVVYMCDVVNMYIHVAHLQDVVYIWGGYD